jgi:chromosome segregation ATPase
MAERIERRRTVTRTVRSEGAAELKRNMSNIADEIGRVRDQAQQEAASLDKIRGMLDVGYLNDLLETIEQMESRFEEESSSNAAMQEDVDSAREELAAEQERLAKLWDAYKTQEDELDRLKRDYPLMEEKLFERDRQIDTLRRELARLEPLAKYKSEYDAIVKEHESLIRDLDRANRDMDKMDDKIASMESELSEMRGMSEFKHRVSDLEGELEEERERLAKLYRVYEELEADKAAVEANVSAWEAWFQKSRSAFEGTREALSTAP